MTEIYDYSAADRPEILSYVFYPRHEWTPLPAGAVDYVIPVQDGVSISCRFYPAGDDAPCILFFHGNGEVACDYDWIAPMYLRQGIGLFVADYRGYGRSDGLPSFSSMMRDAGIVFRFFQDNVGKGDPEVPRFVMGRSLGTFSALAVASQYAQRLEGLIVESGTAHVVGLLDLFGLAVSPEATKRLEETALATVSSITLPFLIIHGDSDTLIPPSEAVWLFEHIGSTDKRLVAIPGAGHNDIMVVGMHQYFAAIKQLVFHDRG